MQPLITFFPSIMDVPDKPAQLISATAAYITALSPEDTSWQAPYSGFWTFVAYGPGGRRGGGSGAASLRTVYLTAGQVINMVVGKTSYGPYNTVPNTAATATVLTFPDGIVVTAGPGANDDGAGGTASGGDVNISGNPSPSTGLGGDAPAIGSFAGAQAASDAGLSSWTPGPGAGGNNPFGGPSNAGPGAVYIYSTGA